MLRSFLLHETAPIGETNSSEDDTSAHRSASLPFVGEKVKMGIVYLFPEFVWQQIKGMICQTFAVS